MTGFAIWAVFHNQGFPIFDQLAFLMTSKVKVGPMGDPLEFPKLALGKKGKAYSMSAVPQE